MEQNVTMADSHNMLQSGPEQNAAMAAHINCYNSILQENAAMANCRTTLQ